MKAQVHPDEIKYWQLIEEIFGKHPRGQELLEVWENRYLKAPTVPTRHKLEASALPPEMAQFYPYIREGENKLVRHIRGVLIQYNSFKQQRGTENGTITGSHPD